MPPDANGEALVPSPCVSVCVLDPCGSGICTGCGRSLDEIGAWVDLDNAGRRAVIARLPARLAAMQLRNRIRGHDDADR